MRDVDFFVTIPYLVDKLDSGCVLRMRPLLATDDFCDTVCGFGTDCVANSIILGLPFLHNYCVSYDWDAIYLDNIVFYEQLDPPKLFSICHYTNLTTTTVTPTTPTRKTSLQTLSSRTSTRPLTTTSEAPIPDHTEGRGRL